VNLVNMTSDLKAMDIGSAQAKRSAALEPLRDTVNQAVGAVFFGPLLRSARSSAFKSEIGHGGRGEDVFQNQMDQILIERAGRASGNRITEAIVDRFANAAMQHAGKGPLDGLEMVR
jgi:hypothetical protein